MIIFILGFRVGKFLAIVASSKLRVVSFYQNLN